MNILIKLYYLFLLFIPFPSDHLIDPSENYYCNARYDFCVEYAIDLFDVRKSPSNADGIFLSNSSERISMAVYGEYDVFKSTIQDHHMFLLESLKKSDGQILDHVTIFAENSYTCNIEFEYHTVEVRSKKVDNYFVNAIIRIQNENNTDIASRKDNIKITIES